LGTDEIPAKHKAKTIDVAEEFAGKAWGACC
jgi:hypothetical protein